MFGKKLKIKLLNLRIVFIHIFCIFFQFFGDHPISFVFAKTSNKIAPIISIQLKIKGSETAQVNFDTVPSSM
jgi:hypothetical protein